MTSLLKDQYSREKCVEALICDYLHQALTTQLTSALCNARDGGGQHGKWCLYLYVSTNLKLRCYSSVYKDIQKYNIICFVGTVKKVKLSLDVQEIISYAKKT